MPNAVMPIASKQDSRYFAVDRENNTVVGQMEGGYSHTRPRTTRAPRRIFSTGFTNISQADLDALQDFYDEVGGHSLIDYVDPTSGATYVVRIEEWPTARFVGMGGNNRYDFSTIKLKEV